MGDKFVVQPGIGRYLRWAGTPYSRRWHKQRIARNRRRIDKDEVRHGLSQEEPTLDEYFGVSAYERRNGHNKYRTWNNRQLWSQLRDHRVVVRFDDVEEHYDGESLFDDAEMYADFKRSLEEERGPSYYSLDAFYDDDYEWDGRDDWDYEPYDRLEYVFKDSFGRWRSQDLTPEQLKTDAEMAQSLFLRGAIKTPEEDFSECELRYEDHWGGDDWDDCATMARLNRKDQESAEVVDLKELWRRNGLAV